MNLMFGICTPELSTDFLGSWFQKSSVAVAIYDVYGPFSARAFPLVKLSINMCGYISLCTDNLFCVM